MSKDQLAQTITDYNEIVGKARLLIWKYIDPEMVELVKIHGIYGKGIQLNSFHMHAYWIIRAMETDGDNVYLHVGFSYTDQLKGETISLTDMQVITIPAKEFSRTLDDIVVEEQTARGLIPQKQDSQ